MKKAFTLAEVFTPYSSSQCKIFAQFIGDFAGVTSRSTERAGFAKAHTAPYPKIGFTLAEVLVTLGIIGVVSAMTVPSLMQNYQRQSYVTQLHKVYNEFQQAAMSYVNDKNALNLIEAGLNSQAAVNDFMTKYFRVIQTCDKTDNCFETLSVYKRFTGTAITTLEANCKSFVIASGASIRPLYAKDGNKLVNVLVDINGKKGPNILGRDLFIMCLYNNGMLDDYSSGNDAPLTEAQRTARYNADCIGTTNAYGCFGKILNDNWQMTY